MRGWKWLTWGVLGTTALSGCAVSTPRELLDARTAYQQASAGPASQYSPDSLEQARLALDEANNSFTRERATERTRTLAYVALRKAQLAEAQARIVLAEQERRQAEQQLAQAHAANTERSRQELLQARTNLAEAQRLREEAEQRQLETQQQLTAQQQAELQRQQQAELQRQQEATRVQAEQEAQEQTRQEALKRTQDQERIAQLNAQLEQERQARLQAEERATQAETEAHAQQAAADELRNIREVQVKEEARGLVLTLSGSVLFASGSAELLEPARRRLDEVADALKKTQNSLLIEGHTDSQGSPRVNQELSYLRAESVRRYLVDRGVDGSRIRSEGLGSEQPIASNATSEGRANNRRVEIVLQRDVGGSGAPSR